MHAGITVPIDQQVSMHAIATVYDQCKLKSSYLAIVTIVYHARCSYDLCRAINAHF